MRYIYIRLTVLNDNPLDIIYYYNINIILLLYMVYVRLTVLNDNSFNTVSLI